MIPPAPAVTIGQAVVEALGAGLTFREAAAATGAAVAYARALFETELGIRGRPAQCAPCGGTGAKDGQSCKNCGGAGMAP